MKLYSAAPKASISMVTDDRLSRALIQLHQTSPLTHILETGTYVGLGSTRFIAEILASHPPVPQMFVTIEASYSNWRRAKRNLKRFPFVKPLWGLSTSRQDAQNFIESDVGDCDKFAGDCS